MMPEGFKILSKKFTVTWLIVVLVMFSLSIIWHGIILNDLERLDVPLQQYLYFSFIFYLVIGFALMYFFLISFSLKKVKPIIRGILLGVFTGLAVYFIMELTGVSFTSNLSEKQLVVDLTWQAIEQGIGGLVIVFVYDA